MIFDPRPILMALGSLFLVMAAFMMAPLLADLMTHDGNWPAFLSSASVAAFIGVALTLSAQGHIERITIRESILVTVLSWVVAPAIGAVPLMLSLPDATVTDTYFEAMSAMTTTGATVLSGLDTMPAGILLWRSILQWIGGIGIIVMGIALMPMMRTGGIRLFRLESSERGERAMPRVQNFVVMMVSVYLGLTVCCATGYYLAGMNTFDAVCHAMSTLATGGFSNYDASFGAFKSPAIEWVAIVFMAAGGLPFFLYINALRTGPGALFLNPQVRGLFSVLIFSSVSIAIWLWMTGQAAPADAFRLAAFNVTSVVTTTGFASTDYGTWGVLPLAFFFFLTFIGGCTGSTAGGIKIQRFQVILFELRHMLRLLLSPHSMRQTHTGDRTYDPEAVIGSLVFALIFLLTTALISISLAAQGLDLITSVTATATAMANVGPGLGPIVGPAGNFAPLPDAVKWTLSAAMMLGRLELFAVFVLFTRQFWRF